MMQNGMTDSATHDRLLRNRRPSRQNPDLIGPAIVVENPGHTITNPLDGSRLFELEVVPRPTRLQTRRDILPLAVLPNLEADLVRPSFPMPLVFMDGETDEGDRLIPVPLDPDISSVVAGLVLLGRREPRPG